MKLWLGGAIRRWRSAATERAVAAHAAGGDHRIKQLGEFFTSIKEVEAAMAEREAAVMQQELDFESERERLAALEETVAAQTARHARWVAAAHEDTRVAVARRTEHSATTSSRLTPCWRASMSHKRSRRQSRRRRARRFDQHSAALRAQKVAHAKQIEDLRERGACPSARYGC